MVSYTDDILIEADVSNTAGVPTVAELSATSVIIPTVPSVLIITVAPLGIVPLATKLPTPDSTPVSCDPSP